jgi:hypothetical protein
VTPRETLKSERLMFKAKHRPIRSETDLKSAIVDALTAKGHWAYVINSGKILLRGRSVQLMPPGAGDVQGLLQGGRAYFLEAKLPGQTQNDNEIEWQSKCLEKGVFYAVVESINEALQVVALWVRQAEAERL